MSPENCGVFKVMKKEAHLTIAREDWAIDVLLNIHLFSSVCELLDEVASSAICGCLWSC